MRLRKWVVSLAGIQNILSLMKVFDCGCLFVGMDSREVISFLVDKSNWPEREVALPRVESSRCRVATRQ
jgi:hypothetical protein